MVMDSNCRAAGCCSGPKEHCLAVEGIPEKRAKLEQEKAKTEASPKKFDIHELARWPVIYGLLLEIPLEEIQQQYFEREARMKEEKKRFERMKLAHQAKTEETTRIRSRKQRAPRWIPADVAEAFGEGAGEDYEERGARDSSPESGRVEEGDEGRPLDIRNDEYADMNAYPITQRLLRNLRQEEFNIHEIEFGFFEELDDS